MLRTRIVIVVLLACGIALSSFAGETPTDSSAKGGGKTAADQGEKSAATVRVGGQIPKQAANTPQLEKRIKELRRLAQLSVRRKRWQHAASQAKELVAVRPFDTDYQLTLGLLFRKLNNLEEARRKYSDFLDFGGSPAVGYLMLAESYAVVGDKDEALKYLEHAAAEGMNVMKAVEQFPTLEPYRSDTSFIKLALKLEHYELKKLDRPDPFTNPFRKIQERPEDLVRRKSKSSSWSHQKQDDVLNTARRWLARIEHALRRQDEEKAMEAYSNLLDLEQYADKFTVPRLASEFRAIMDRKSEIEAGIEEIRLSYYYGQAQQKIESMERAFINHDFPLVERIHGEVEGIAQSMVEINSDFEEVSNAVLKVGGAWVLRARVWREFIGKRMRIQGIVTSDDEAYAIVNNSMLRAGNRYQGMRVLKIEPNQVWFDYQGERIPLIFRRY
ncbi:MAG: hypothetical protein ACE5GW_02415 [Planctomycetota bacterium]